MGCGELTRNVMLGMLGRGGEYRKEGHYDAKQATKQKAETTTEIFRRTPT